MSPIDKSISPMSLGFVAGSFQRQSIDTAMDNFALGMKDPEFCGLAVEPIYPSYYPYPIGHGLGKTSVFELNDLYISHIPQLRAEFARTRRDDLLLLDFIDLVSSRVGPGPLRTVEDLGESARAEIGRALASLGFGLADKGESFRLLARLSHLASVRSKTDVLAAISPMIEGSALREILASPRLHRDDRLLPAICVIKKDSGLALNKKFLHSPSEFIESSPTLWPSDESNRPPSTQPGGADPGRLRKFTLGDRAVVSKRVDPLRVRSVEEEILNASKVAKAIASNGVSTARTVDYLGLVYDRGNFYILMKDEFPAEEVYYNPTALEKLDEVSDALQGSGLKVSPKHSMWKGKELILFGFESEKDDKTAYKTPENSFNIIKARLSKADSVEAFKSAVPEDILQDIYAYRRLGDAINTFEIIKSGAHDELPTNVAISDIHGSADRMNALLELPSVQNANKRFWLGDYFDRGRKNTKVFERMISLDPGSNVFLLGNHDAYFLSTMFGNKHSFLDWALNGGLRFVNEVLDLGVVRDNLRSAKAESERDAVTFALIKDPDSFEDLRQRVVESGYFRAVADWLIKNAGLVHVDEYGFMYSHAGVSSGLQTDLFYVQMMKRYSMQFGKAAAVENSWVIGHDDKTLGAVTEGTKDAMANFLDTLEMREEWLTSYVKEGYGNAVLRLNSLGLSGSVYGHTIKDRATETLDRFFAGDLGMFLGRGGALELGPNGVRAIAFGDRSDDTPKTTEILDREYFLRMIADDAPRIIRVLQNYFSRP